MAGHVEQRVLVIAPTRRDGELTCAMLADHNIRCDLCTDAAGLVNEINQGAGAVLIAEEFLNDEGELLAEYVRRQPSWSDLPVILVTRRGLESPAVTRALEMLGNVTLVERPTKVLGLANAVRNALRARQRQYQTRDLIIERERNSAALQESEQRYRTLVEQVKDYAIFMIDLEGRATSWNEGVLRVLGFTETEFIGLNTSKRIFTPEDQAVGVPEAELEQARKTGSASDDRWMMRSNGKHFWASGITSALYDPQGQHIGYTKVMRDLTRNKEAENALKEADRRKNEFLATLAHELRNPLAPIRNSMHILQMTAGNNKTINNVCSMLERQVEQLVRLVDDLLEVSRITRGKIELRKEEVDLAMVVRSAVETSLPIIDTANHRLNVSLPELPLTVWGDPVRLSQVLANLLNNAAKYTNEGGEIGLRVTVEGEQAMISVRDNGIGIPESMLANVFEMFMQVDRTTKRAQGGLGIGLTLVKSLVELHGGTVGVHSDPTEPGSEFIVRLPIFRNHQLETSVPQASKTVGSLEGRRVLVVDDNIDAAKSLRMLLKMQGAQSEMVHNGFDALEAIKRLQPNVVLLDIGMPGMDGYEVARRVRASGEFNELKLVALTGWGQEEDRQKTREAGFDHHLVKPADIAKLKELLAGM
jgi:PAS domain S-box-containing protein